MRRPWLVIAGALLATCTAPGSSAGSTYFSLGGGTVTPTGSFRDVSRNGVTFEADLRHMLLPVFGLGVSATYANFHAADDLNDAIEAAYGNGSTLVFTDWNYSAFAVVAIPVGRVTAYARGGAGVYNPKMQIRSPLFGIADVTRSELGFLAGGGVTIRFMSRLALGVDGTWHRYDDSQWGFEKSWVTSRVSLLYELPGLNDALRHR